MNNIIKTLHFVPDVSTEHSLSQRNFFIAMTIVMETHNSRITLQYKWRHNVWRKKKRYSKRVFGNIRVSSVKQTGWGLNIWNGIFIVGLFDDFVHQEITFLVSLSRRIPWGAMGFFFRTTRELEYLFIFQNLTLGYMTKTQNQIIIFFLHQNQNIFSATLEVK
jgi:hypothetical protein